MSDVANKIIYTMMGVSKFHNKKAVLKDISLSYFYGAKIGVLGLINGVVGDSPTGVIGAKGRIDGATGQFTEVRAFVDLRIEKVDVIA